jgi:hypothetical protein
MKTIDDYIIGDKWLTKNSYQELIPAEESTVRYDLLLGCGEGESYLAKLKQDKLTDQEVFELDRYAYYGQGCVDFNNQTSIYLQAEVSNQLVVTDQAEATKHLDILSEYMRTPFQLKVTKIKTAVGKIQNNVMRISVSEF